MSIVLSSAPTQPSNRKGWDDLSGPRGRVLTTLRAMRDPYRWQLEWQAEHGDPFRLDALNGRVVLSGRPEWAKAVFALPASTFRPFAVNTLAPLFGSGSLLLLDGERHRRERRLLQPSFQGARLHAWKDEIREIGRGRSAGWGEGRAIEATAETRAVTFEVIVRIVFGAESDEEVAILSRTAEQLLGSVASILLFSRASHVRFFGLSPWDKLLSARARLWALLQVVIERRRQSGARSSDVLSLLLDATFEDGTRLSDEDLFAELLTLLVAGHETTTISLAWALHFAATHPEALAQLRKEVSENTEDKPLLDGWVKESLRLNPIVDAVFRTLVEPVEIEGFTFEPGVSLAVSPVLLHLNPEVYPEPERFLPSRYFERKYLPHEHVAFGGGVRRCIGAALATLEMRVVLEEWLGRFDFEPLGQPRAVRKNLVMAPNGVPLRVRRRSPSEATA